MLSFSVCLPILQAKAGDTGTPATSQSDATYFYYVHGDHLGSSHVITEGNRDGGKHAGLKFNRGDLIQRIEYSPFGQEKFVLNPNIKYDPEFTGQKYDMESGLYYYKARYYNPKIGRFVQPDTVVPSVKDFQSFNRYAYVRNNPLKYVDPSGHSFWGWFKKLIGIFASIVIGAIVFALLPKGMDVVLAAAITGMAAGAGGGLVGGIVNGSIKDALLSGLIGLVTGFITAVVGSALSGPLGKMGSMAVLKGADAGVNIKAGGWEGLVTFGISLIGACASKAIASSGADNDALPREAPLKGEAAGGAGVDSAAARADSQGLHSISSNSMAAGGGSLRNVGHLYNMAKYAAMSWVKSKINYVDLNINYGVYKGVGPTVGLMYNVRTGEAHVYGGVGIMQKGPGVALTASGSEVTTGVNAAVQGGQGFGGQLGVGANGPYVEAGIVTGFSGSVFYVSEPINGVACSKTGICL